ncbi:uncharacterized protein [Cherax quadricarinatus]|uniref:uncharacterized protein n=1 Tax=Cherax quadricarinatus TaxID=27406 RepID=UPI00387EB312
MIWSTYSHNRSSGKQYWTRYKRTYVVVMIAATTASALLYLLLRRVQNEVHPVSKFEDKLREACANPLLPMLEYRGVQSFFEYLTKPDDSHCYSWVEFGGEKIPIPSQSEKECTDEVRKTKYICFNEEYNMTHDPCLVYSFGKDVDNQFERDMELFSCEVHAFDHEKVTEAEHVQRSEFWREHAWNIAAFPYDLPEEGGKVQRRRSLDYIVGALSHGGRQINFLKSDLEGREWILLRQVISSLHLLDVRQIGVRLHIPVDVNKKTGEARHQYFAKLFQVFQGLQCAGYKYVMGRAIRYYKGVVRIPEIGNITYFPAYEVNWAKVV